MWKFYSNKYSKYRPIPYICTVIDTEYLSSLVPERFLCDERYRRGHIGILAPRPGTRILGMHTPEMKKVAKDLLRSGAWREQLEQRLGLIDEFIPAVDNWAICDNFCCNAKWVEREDKEELWLYIKELLGADEELRNLR